MVALDLTPLLALQESDMKRLALAAQLEATPREIAAVKARIAAERQAIELAKADWHALETKKKSLETEILAAEGKASKYRTQQLEVRKNDEYRALAHEIETVEAAIAALEEQELEVMFAIDEAKRRFAAAEAELQANIAGHEARIAALHQREAETQAALTAALAEVAAARPAVPEDQLGVFDRLARKPGHPVCAPLTGGRCGGCHMRVSSNVEFEVRKGENLTTCDQCGRMLHWAP